MDKIELNKQVKALFKSATFKKPDPVDVKDWQKQFIKLVAQDIKFLSFNRQSILMLIVLNNWFEFMADARLVEDIDIEQLLKI